MNTGDPSFPVWGSAGVVSARAINAILLHELAHLRRRDDWTNLAQEILRALFFFSSWALVDRGVDCHWNGKMVLRSYFVLCLVRYYFESTGVMAAAVGYRCGGERALFGERGLAQAQVAGGMQETTRRIIANSPTPPYCHPSLQARSRLGSRIFQRSACYCCLMPPGWLHFDGNDLNFSGIRSARSSAPVAGVGAGAGAQAKMIPAAFHSRAFDPRLQKCSLAI